MENHKSSSASSVISLTLLLTLMLFSFNSRPCHGERVAPQEQKSTEFIKTSCSATQYPDLCYSSLSSYASIIQTSTLQLAQAALSVSLSAVRSTSTMMSQLSSASGLNPRAAGAMKDCMETLGDSVDNLKQSLDAMGHLRGKNTGFMIDSIQTWVSAALTDEQTCMDGFAGHAMSGGVKSMVRSHVVNVAQLTCNALALVGGLTSSQSSP